MGIRPGVSLGKEDFAALGPRSAAATAAPNAPAPIGSVVLLRVIQAAAFIVLITVIGGFLLVVAALNAPGH